ncbi:MAG: hypothetical protein IT581_12990 [Verrucomicrobiales bacterium]|nr:hypothetical protein [Verrucomicrobiales bacterium]
MTTLRQNSPSRLQLNSRPSPWLMAFLWLALLAYLFLVMPGTFIRLNRRDDQKVDARVESRLFGWSMHWRVIRGITNAEIQRAPHRTSIHRRRAGEMAMSDVARVTLLTPQGRVPVTEAFSAGLEIHEKAAGQINQFLAASEATSAVVTIPKSGWLYVGLALLLFAAPGVTFGAWCQCVLDRDQDRVGLSWASLPRAQRINYRLSDVERFQVMQTLDSRLADRGRSTPRHTLIMRLKDGQEVSVTRQYDSGVSAAAQELARRLNLFLAGT